MSEDERGESAGVLEVVAGSPASMFAVTVLWRGPSGDLAGALAEVLSEEEMEQSWEKVRDRQLTRACAAWGLIGGPCSGAGARVWRAGHAAD